MIRILYHSSDGDLTFSFNSVDVHLSRSLYWSKNPNAIHLSIARDRAEAHDRVSFEYNPEDLRAALLKWLRRPRAHLIAGLTTGRAS